MTKAVDLFADFAVNESKALEGVYVPYRGDVEFLVARNNNKAYKKELFAKAKQHRRVLDSLKDEALEQKWTEIGIDVLAKTILLGWKGTVAYKGESLEYSEENAKKLLALEGFREWVQEQSKLEAAYKEVQDEEDEKN